MLNKQKMRCKVDPKTGEYSCDRENIKGKCSVSPKSMQGGATILGSGGNFGGGSSNLRCDDKRDIKHVLQKKYPNYDVDVED